MNNSKPKLELTWIGKGEQPKLEPRILIEDPTKSYGDKNSVNMLIYGDNLLALKALEQDYAGKIKCIYIDPPYNTRSAFEEYDDSLEHSTWLNLIWSRLKQLYVLLESSGIIFIQIDDREHAYLKVICDEIFGRNNFVCTFIWEARSGQGNTVGHIQESHEYILCYAKDTGEASFKKIENISADGNFNDSKGSYKREQLRQWGQGDRREDRPSMYYPVTTPDGKQIYPKRPDGSEGRWRVGLDTMKKLLEADDVDFVKDEKNGWVCYKKIRGGRVTYSAFTTLLMEHGTASTATIELKKLFGDKVFSTPKPEILISHLIHLVTEEGDIVLDSFAGSGTTGAVAHKMKRNWIMIELEEHCDTVILPRLVKICNGKDQIGISEAQNWKGGGGFKYYYLAPSLLLQDNRGNWIINKEFNAIQLAAAMAKQEGFRFSPDETYYWRQGKSTEKDYIFTTTNFVSVEFVDTIHSEMKEDESLLICCTSFSKAADKYPNITIKKIPKMLLGRCEFGKEDYSLNIINMPKGNDEPDFVPSGPIASNTKKRKTVAASDDLFTTSEGGRQ